MGQSQAEPKQCCVFVLGAFLIPRDFPSLFGAPAPLEPGHTVRCGCGSYFTVAEAGCWDYTLSEVPLAPLA